MCLNTTSCDHYTLIIFNVLERGEKENIMLSLLLRGYPSTLRELTFYSHGCDFAMVLKNVGGGARVRWPSQIDGGC